MLVRGFVFGYLLSYQTSFVLQSIDFALQGVHFLDPVLVSCSIFVKACPYSVHDLFSLAPEPAEAFLAN